MPETRINHALNAALRFFERRDEMNSEVHLAEVRWSPITGLVRDALKELRSGALRSKAPDPKYCYAAKPGSFHDAGPGSVCPRCQMMVPVYTETPTLDAVRAQVRPARPDDPPTTGTAVFNGKTFDDVEEGRRPGFHYVLLTGEPGPDDSFIEVEDHEGRSVGGYRWLREDGYRLLEIRALGVPAEKPADGWRPAEFDAWWREHGEAIADVAGVSAGQAESVALMVWKALDEARKRPTDIEVRAARWIGRAMEVLRQCTPTGQQHRELRRELLAEAESFPLARDWDEEVAGE